MRNRVRDLPVYSVTGDPASCSRRDHEFHVRAAKLVDRREEHDADKSRPKNDQKHGTWPLLVSGRTSGEQNHS